MALKFNLTNNNNNKNLKKTYYSKWMEFNFFDNVVEWSFKNDPSCWLIFFGEYSGQFARYSLF